MVEDDAARWRKVERGAYDAVLAAVGRLALLDEVDAGAPSYDTVLTACGASWTLRCPVARPWGVASRCTPVRDLVGADLDLLVVVGMTEDSFPPRIREHPVLGDEARHAVGLPTTHDRRLAERRHYLAASASARRVVLSAPKADTRAQRALQPSPWFMEAVTDLNDGEPVTSRELPGLEASWLVRHDSFEQALRRSTSLVSATELGIQLALRAEATSSPTGPTPDSRGRKRRSAAGPPESSTSGPDMSTSFPRRCVDGSSRLVGQQPPNLRDLSAELLAEARAVGAGPRGPGEDDVIDARTRGSLVHASSRGSCPKRCKTMVPHRARAEPRTTAGQPRRSPARTRSSRRSRPMLEAQGVTGRPLLWQAHKARLRRQLTRMLQVDSRRRRSAAPRPSLWRPRLAGRTSTPAATCRRWCWTSAIRGGGAGRLHRPGGPRRGRPVIVIDYKTGKDYGYDRIPASAPRRPRTRTWSTGPQAAAGALRPGRAAGLRPWHRAGRGLLLVRGAGRPARGGPVTPTAEQRLLEVVDVSVGGVRSGVYPARPGDEDWRGGWENCTFCPYDRVCPTTRAEQWEAVRRDPARRSPTPKWQTRRPSTDEERTEEVDQ